MKPQFLMAPEDAAAGATPPVAAVPPVTPPATPPAASGGTATPPPDKGASAAPPKTEQSKVTQERESLLDGSAAQAEIEVKLPKGVEPDALLMNEFKPIAKELGLKSEGAQKIVDLAVKMQAKSSEAAHQQVVETVKGWQAAAQADKEFGGTKFKESLGIANEFLGKYGNSEVFKLLKDSGLGNHPEFIRMFHKAGLELREDSSVGRVGAGSADSSRKDYAAKRYPNTPQFQK